MKRTAGTKFSSRDGAVAYTGQPHFFVRRKTILVASAEPDLWTIHEGKLYLNYSRRINQRWRENMEEYICHPDAQWPRIIEKE